MRFQDKVAIVTGAGQGMAGLRPVRWRRGSTGRGRDSTRSRTAGRKDSTRAFVKVDVGDPARPTRWPQPPSRSSAASTT